MGLHILFIYTSLFWRNLMSYNIHTCLMILNYKLSWCNISLFVLLDSMSLSIEREGTENILVGFHRFIWSSFGHNVLDLKKSPKCVKLVFYKVKQSQSNRYDYYIVGNVNVHIKLSEEIKSDNFIEQFLIYQHQNHFPFGVHQYYFRWLYIRLDWYWQISYAKFLVAQNSLKKDLQYITL